MIIIGFIIILIALVLIWYLGYRMGKEKMTAQKYALPRDYLVGLNFLLNEEPDKAVDIFIKMLEVDSDTVETHLAVGKLFRRRGEVDRAIRIHQNLIARPQLDKYHREQSLFELGHDYLSAGFLDRAERIFLELVPIKDFAAAALKPLLHIYQQEKYWEKAIQMADKLQQISKTSMQEVIAHYYCELAEIDFNKSQLEKALDNIKKAHDSDKNCVRASLLQAKIEMKNENYKQALRSLKRIKSQNPDYLSEAVDLLSACYEALNEEEKFVEYLKQIIEEHPHMPVILSLTERIQRWKGDKEAANFVADYVRRYPSVSGLNLFIKLYISNTEGRAREDLLILKGLMQKLLADKPDYRCVSCGFAGKTLHWQCPSCKQWSSIKPVHVLAEC